MMNLLKSWQGSVEVNGVKYDSITDVLKLGFTPGAEVHIVLRPTVVVSGDADKKDSVKRQNESDEIRITVKRYMTKKATPDFDFMSKWNNNNPMPYVTMTGVKVKETRGMVYMKLHGDIWAKQIPTCMCCGRPLTNPVSQFFGIGPECGGHNYVNPFSSDEELNKAVEQYKAHLQTITWEGWIIKSAITEEEVA